MNQRSGFRAPPREVGALPWWGGVGLPVENRPKGLSVSVLPARYDRPRSQLGCL